MSSQFLHEKAVGAYVKGFTQVQVANIHSIHSPSLIHQVGHLSQKTRLDHTGSAFHKPGMARPDHLVLIYLFFILFIYILFILIYYMHFFPHAKLIHTFFLFLHHGLLEDIL